MVYIEDQSNFDTDAYTYNIWILDDNSKMAFLRKEYRCNMKKQCDGEQEYQIFTFKDHLQKDWNLFCDRKYFSLGKLKSQLIPVTTTYLKCQNLHSTKLLTDSLDIHNVNYTITPTDSIVETINEFAIVLDLGINISSKLWKNNDTLFTTWTPNAEKELKRLFPDLVINDISFQRNMHWEAEPPGYSLSNSEKDKYYFEHKQLRFILTSNIPFKLDITRLNASDLFVDSYIRPMYIVTTYNRK
jgi:hypothetical protein